MTTAATEAIARFAVESDLSGIDGEALRIATRAFVDTVGVAIAGVPEVATTALTAAMPAPVALPGAGATLIASGVQTSAAHAALVNATAGHALDFDDHLNDVNGHPSVVLVPPILAVCESRSLSGRQALEAYVVGHQVMCAICAALPVRAHWTRGWHATGTVGVMAATAACARLLGLDVLRTRYALGIAASLASGSRQNCGFTVKPLHAGMAASHAVLAASLAENGYDADPEHLESDLGYFRVFGVDPDLGRIGPVLDERWTVTTRGLNVKSFPACYAVHPAARAASIIAARGIDPDGIESVDVTVQPTGLTGPIHHRPTTGLQAKFSMEYTVAAALTGEALSLRSFEDAAVARPQIQRLIPLVATHEADVPPIGPPEYGRWFSAVRVRLRDGAVLTERADMPHGHSGSPLSDAELDAKFVECAQTPGSAWDGRRLLRGIRGIDDRATLRGLFADALASRPIDPHPTPHQEME